MIRGRPVNVSHITGVRHHTGHIESPRYPHAYPSGVRKNYILVNEADGGRVRLIFDDFQLHYQSELKVSTVFAHRMTSVNQFVFVRIYSLGIGQ